MTLVANQSFVLGKDEDSKDVTQATGAPTIGVDDIGIHLNTNVTLYARTSTAGAIRVLRRWLVDNLATISSAGNASIPLTGSKASVVTTVPATDSVALYWGSNVPTNGSHFIDETVKQLEGVIREATAGN
jgi:hypothetical protein